MEDELIYLPQMLLIGSSGRNSGKTTLAASLIRNWKDRFPIIALKITTIEEKNGKCPRGGRGCGVCTNIKEKFQLIEEKISEGNKDTSLLLAAGAERVYWLKVLKTYIEEGIEYFLKEIPENNLIICESNSLRNIVKSGAFIMLKNTQNSSIKKSACEVIDKADLIVEEDFRDNIDKIIDKIKVNETQQCLSVEIKDI